MIARLLLIGVALQAGIWAQLSLFQVDPTTKAETPVTATLLDLGSVAPGDTLTTSFHVKNLSNAPVSLVLNVAGAGFKLALYDLNPCMLPPATTQTTAKACGYFDVLYSPSLVGPTYSAVLTANNITVTLRASAVPQPVLSFNGAQLATNGTADFGQVQRGSSVSKTFTISNPFSAPVHIGAISVAGDAFSGPKNMSPPLDIAPGTSTTFDVVFAPQAAGQATGTLSIDQRTYKLTGLATVPPLPKGTITVSSQTATSGQQLTVSVALASTSAVTGTGTLTLAFQPASGLPDDPAIQFLSGAKRNATVSIAPGDSSAKVNSQANLAFQTGTTAGTIVLTLTLPNSTDQFTIPIAPAVVNVSSATATRRLDGIDLTVNGFDNTHSVSQLQFTFYDASNKILQPGVMRVDATPNFKQYFATSQTGGSFTMLATFPVTGDTSQIKAVDIQISNSAGITNAQHITF